METTDVAETDTTDNQEGETVSEEGTEESEETVETEETSVEMEETAETEEETEETKETAEPEEEIDEAEKQYVKGGTNSEDFTFDGKLYTVSFTNTYNGETHFDGGVINHFNLDGDGFKPGTPEGKTHNN